MKVNFLANQIELNKREYQEAQHPYSRAFSELIELKRMLPQFQIAVIERKFNAAQITYRGLTYAYMEFIIQKNAPEEMDQYIAVRSTYQYPMVKSWFIKRFPAESRMVDICSRPETAA